MLRTTRYIRHTISTARNRRKMSSSIPDAIVLPVFQKEFSPVPEQFKREVDPSVLWKSTRAKTEKALEKRIFHQDGPTLALVAVGKEGSNENARREAARKAIATGVKAARDAGARSIGVVSHNILTHDAAVASKLAAFKFTLKTKDVEPPLAIECLSESSQGESGLDWKTGSLYAEGQNMAREFMELPGNLMTPTVFCKRATQVLKGLPNVTVHVRDEAWAAEKEMRSFLSVTAGTAEPANSWKFITMVPQAQIHVRSGWLAKALLLTPEASQ